MTKRKDKDLFGFIRYANCWEDADILLQGLDAHSGSRILSIASAGDNSFSLLTTDPLRVVAVDVNKTQLHLVELKKAAIRYLKYEELLSFLGFSGSEMRLKMYDELKHLLPEETKQYWERHSGAIQNGIIHQGKFERYFRMFSGKILPLIHSKDRIEQLLKHKSEEEQKSFYRRKWNTWRWRLFFRIFFSKYVMGKYGRDPEFMKEVSVPVGTYIFRKAEEHLQRSNARQNVFLRYNLTGSFGNLLPHYLQKENLEKIKYRIDRLHTVEGYADEAIRQFGKFDRMNLSNIFEYMSMDAFSAAARQLLEGTDRGGRLAYWNLMVPRRVSALFPERIIWKEELSLRLKQSDKGFFYNHFIIDEIK